MKNKSITTPNFPPQLKHLFRTVSLQIRHNYWCGSDRIRVQSTSGLSRDADDITPLHGWTVAPVGSQVLGGLRQNFGNYCLVLIILRNQNIILWERVAWWKLHSWVCIWVTNLHKWSFPLDTKRLCFTSKTELMRKLEKNKLSLLDYFSLFSIIDQENPALMKYIGGLCQNKVKQK